MSLGREVTQGRALPWNWWPASPLRFSLCAPWMVCCRRKECCPPYSPGGPGAASLSLESDLQSLLAFPSKFWGAVQDAALPSSPAALHPLQGLPETSSLSRPVLPPRQKVAACMLIARSDRERAGDAMGSRPQQSLPLAMRTPGGARGRATGPGPGARWSVYCQVTQLEWATPHN